MLIGCITGPDFLAAKTQIELAQKYCNGIELRQDLLQCEPVIPNMDLIITTDANGSGLSDGRTMSTYHNFDETPKNLDEILSQMPTADLYKICTMANSTIDAVINILKMVFGIKKK